MGPDGRLSTAQKVTKDRDLFWRHYQTQNACWLRLSSAWQEVYTHFTWIVLDCRSFCNVQIVRAWLHDTISHTTSFEHLWTKSAMHLASWASWVSWTPPWVELWLLHWEQRISQSHGVETSDLKKPLSIACSVLPYGPILWWWFLFNDERCRSLQLFIWGDESNYCAVEKVQLDHKA